MADEQEPSEQEAIDALEAELRKLRVSDVLVQTVLSVSSLGFRKLSDEDRDLEQARLAIEALKALVPVLSGTLPEQAIRDFQAVIANLQLAYVKAAG